MATLFWTLLMLYPFLAHSQSGDDEESIDMNCWSLLTLKQSSLICALTDYDPETCEKFATLCPEVSQEDDSVCSNATMERDRFTFQNLSPISMYKMHINLKGGQHQTQTFNLTKIVKITTPEIENATYELDEAVIHIKYMHDYVIKPEFQVEFWGDHSKVKKKVKSTEQEVRIGGHMLKDSEIYNVHVRAKPLGYFNGGWTDWSTVKSFKVKEESIDMNCWSLLTLKQSSLICALNHKDLVTYEKFATLCPEVSQKDDSVCSNVTMERDRFTFQNLSPISMYKMHINLKGGQHQTQTFYLTKIVKITTPEIENATYELDEAVIHIKYMHDYVIKPEFQVEFWGDHSKVKKKVKSTEQEVRIGGHMLKDSEIYNVHVRAKPLGYFNGGWTDWSTVKSFKVKEEPIDMNCWSLLTLKQSSLICALNHKDLVTYEKFATLCPEVSQKDDSVCSNVTMERDRFTFQNLSPISMYKMHINLKGGQHQTQTFYLTKIVKITTPEIENATYELDEAVIHIKYMHDYVIKPEFQVEFWGDHSKVKKMVKSTEQEVRIGGHMLKDSEIYNVHVRAKPLGYFNGGWTDWSTVKSFKVKGAETPLVLYILLCITPPSLVLIAIGFLILRCKKEIQACLFPDIPDPKAALAQIYKQKDHLPVSFSPEIFKDVNIYPVIFSEEKQFTPEFGDDQAETTESCDEVTALKCSRPTSMCEEQGEDDQSLDSETSQMKMKLLYERASAEDVHDNPGCQSAVALQGHSKDETYVTMSNLYKTQ